MIALLNMTLLPKDQEPSCSYALNAHHCVALLVQTFLENVVCACSRVLFEHETRAGGGEQYS